MIKAADVQKLSAKVNKEATDRQIQQAVDFLDKFISEEIQRAAERGFWSVAITSDDLRNSGQYAQVYYNMLFRDNTVRAAVMNKLHEAGFETILTESADITKRITIKWNTNNVAQIEQTVKCGDTVYLVEKTCNVEKQKLEFTVSSYTVKIVQYDTDNINVNISRQGYDFEENWFILGTGVFKDESEAIALRNKLAAQYEN